VFSALGDPGRRTILQHLATRPHAVHELAAVLPISRSAVSQHLKILREAGLVTVRREGKFIFYSARPAGLQPLTDWLAGLTADTVAEAAPAAITDVPNTSGARRQHGPDDEALKAELEQWGRIWPEIDPMRSAMRIWIRRISEILDQLSIEHGRRFNINLTDISILGVLYRIGPPHESTPTNLSRISLTSMPGMTRRLDHLEGLGLITRLPSTDDRRSRVVRLTAAGSKILREYLTAQFSTPLEGAFEFPPDELRTLAGGLRKLLLRLEAAGGNTSGIALPVLSGD
jgi:DNA-binding MarR family transcriptional regulator